MQNSNIEKTMTPYELDELDEKILKLIVGDARKPFLEVARVCNVSGVAIHQRVQKLIHAGVIKSSEFMLDSRMIGYKTCAYMGLFLRDPGQFTSIVDALKDIPEVVECYYTTGKYDLFIKIYAHDNEHLLKIIHDRLQPLGLARTETLISLREGFRRHLPINLSGDAGKGKKIK